MKEPKLFKEVDGHVVRSSMPTESEHLDFLKSKGVGSILSLDAMSPVIQSQAKRRGITIKEIPIDTEEPPSDAELKEAFEYIHQNAKEGRRTLIHCNAGRQRTSAMVVHYLVAKGETPLLAWAKHDYGAHQKHKASIMSKQNHLKKLMHRKKK